MPVVSLGRAIQEACVPAICAPMERTRRSRSSSALTERRGPTNRPPFSRQNDRYRRD
jgi:hypothetical protein